jgi:diaminopimelate decarboxylase
MTIRPLRGFVKAQAKRVIKAAASRTAGSGPDMPPSRWGLQRDGSGTLTLHGTSLRDLAARHGSPLHVVDGRKLDANAADFQSPRPGGSHGCLVCYSYKTNPVPAVLQRLHAAGIGAEVISAYELWLALRLGVAADRIIYNGPAKSDESLRDAAAAGIRLVNLNSRTEIPRMAAAARAVGRRMRVGVRVSFPDGWGQQFGESVATGAAVRAFEEALAVPEFEIVALHVHRGNEIAAREDAEGFVDRVLAFTDVLASRFGLQLEIIDFGGSLACPTAPPFSPLRFRLNSAVGADLAPRSPAAVVTIRDYVAMVQERVERHYAGRAAPTIALEPGRALTANTQMLLTSVHEVRDPSDALTLAILDAGMNIASPVQGSYHQLLPVTARPGAPERAYRLAGPICTPADILYRHWRLPELVPGDLLAIMDAGAYFVPFSTSFSFPQPGIVMVDELGSRLVRRAETFEDMVVRDRVD